VLLNKEADRTLSHTHPSKRKNG